MESYRCYRIWLWDSSATRMCDTITGLPTKITMPLATTADLILAGIMDIQQALLSAPSDLHIPPSHVAALKQLTEVLTASTTCKPEVSALPPHESLRVDSRHITHGKSIVDSPPPLRVESPTLEPNVTKKSSLNVHFVSTPSTTSQPAYKNTTGIKST
jgi:hypothetical protein